MSKAGSYTTGGGGGGAVDTLTGDAGGAISPDGLGNISLVGGNDITITGTGGTNSLSVDLTGTLQYRVQVGDGTGGISNLPAASEGEFLVGQAAGNPLFDNEANGPFTFYSNTVGVTRNFTVQHNDNTSDASRARFILRTGGPSGGDPLFQWTVATVGSWTQGMDNSDFDKYKLTTSNSLGTNDALTMTRDGEVNYPLTPAFLVYLNSTIPNQTGNGATVVVPINLQVFDQSADYSVATYTFTAAVDGRYLFNYSVTIGGIAIASSGQVRLVTSNRTYVNIGGSPSVCMDSSNQFVYNASVIADMDAADTAYLDITINGEAGNTVDIIGGATAITYISGTLIC